MILYLVTAPTVEPVTLSEAKAFLRLDSGTLADNLTPTQVLAPASQATTGGAYTLYTSSVDMLGYNGLAVIHAGTFTTGVVDAKLQESDDDATWTDWTGGTFTQITSTNHNADHEKEYTGQKRYLRIAIKVATLASLFGASIVKQSPISTDDTLITSQIKAARRKAEHYLGRVLITQTWQFWLDAWPDKDYIRLPYPPLVSVTAAEFKYYDTADAATVVTSTDYTVDSYSEPGRIFLNDGKSWPSTTLRPYKAIGIQFVCGYGASGSYVPEDILDAIKFWTQVLWSRGAMDMEVCEKAFQHLLDGERMIPV